jgi:CDP-diacylglycerol--glycerol-3-phosphate 3-phosphatidyltransferase
MRVLQKLWPQVPNAISSARLLATPVLFSAAVREQRQLFTWLLLACLVSDILDGLIARVFRLQSRLGSLLDSTADMIVFALTVGGVFVFHREFLWAHAGPIGGLVGLYFVEVAGAVWRYGRISSFHTILARVAAYAQGIFVMSLFLWGYHAGIFFAMVALSSASLLEEILLLTVLPEWKTDVRGLYWVLAKP